MMTDFRYAGAAARLVALAMLPACMVIAQNTLDENSLLAQEDLAVSEAVAGALPEADIKDDFLSELLAGESFELPKDIDVLADSALPTADLVTEQPADSFELPTEEPLPQSLDSVVDGIAAEPAADIDAFPLDAGFDADAVLDEMLEMGDSEAIKELGNVDQETAAASAAVAPAEDSDTDLEAMLGEMVAEEKTADPVESIEDADNLDELVGELTAEQEVGPGGEVAAAEEVILPDAPPLANAEPASIAADADNLEDLIGELAIEAEADLGGEVAAAEEDLILPDAFPVAPVIAEEVTPMVDIAEEVTPMVETAEEVTPMVDIAEDLPLIEEVDPMALDEDIFKVLASEGKAEMRQSSATTKSGTQPSEVAVDPFVGLSGDLAGETEAGVKSAIPSSPASPSAAVPSVTQNVEPLRAEDWTGEAPSAAPALQGNAVRRNAPEGAAAFEEAERLKRRAQEFHAKNTLISADKALSDKDYPRSIRLYEEALRHMPKRADTEPLLAQARKGLGASYYLQALALERMNDLENAKINGLNATRNGYPRAEEAVARIQSKIDKPEPPPPPPSTTRWTEEEFKTTQVQIRSWLKRGREAYLTGEYEKAILAFESVLARDPENKEAIRLMHSAANKQYDRSSMELNATSARMIATVRDTWNSRQYGLHEAPIRNDGRMVTDRQEDEVQRMAILAKMGAIRIPEVDFRQANIRDVVNFLFSQSAEFDPDPIAANRKGVNIILKLDSDPAGGAGAALAPPMDPFAAIPAAGGLGAGGVSETLVTFSARDISLKEALDIVVDIAGLKYLIRGNVVMVMPRNAAVGEIEHRMYDVLPSAIARLQELSTAVAGGGGQGGGRRGGGDFLALESTGGTGGEDVDLKVFFTEMGVEWPSKSSIKFVRGLGKLVVANTIENLAVFEKVLSILNVVPYQIEIEARFIEVAQTDVDSLGLEWLLNDNWELAQKRGSEGVPLAQRERIQMNANSGQGGFTAGNRFLSTAGLSGPSGVTMIDEIARLSGVLTNPELTVVLHALQQKGHTDLLSAPKITTQSGQQATIKVVTEYIYPTEFETSGIGGDNANNAGGGGAGGGVVGAVVTPREFVTREVGVILDVLPEVSPEGQMINLMLSPEVVSEPTWRNFGSTYTSYDPNGNPIVQSLNMEQPFFHTRKLKTNLLIYNGATVVMGGMITEARTNVDDKIPLLGDIPLIGRLFRSKYESSEKRNLLIFVTARLVDPAGRALDRGDHGDKSIAERLAVGGEAAKP